MNRTLIAEAVLSLHALLYSTSYFHPALFFSGAAGLFLARSFSPNSLYLFAPIAAGAILSIIFGSAPGPTAESILVWIGAFGWLCARAQSDGRVFSLFAALLSVGAIAEKVVVGGIPHLWMLSTIDLGLAILVLGFAGRRHPILLGLVCVAVILSTSRALILAAAVGLFFAVNISFRRKIILALGVVAISAPLVMARIESDPLAWNRARMYAAAMSLISERPWTGWGLGAYDAVSRRAHLPDPLPIRHMRAPIHAHCDPLELLFEIGIPLGAAAIAGWLLLMRRRRDAALAAISVVSLFYFPLHLGFPLYCACYRMGRE